MVAEETSLDHDTCGDGENLVVEIVDSLVDLDGFKNGNCYEIVALYVKERRPVIHILKENEKIFHAERGGEKIPWRLQRP